MTSNNHAKIHIHYAKQIYYAMRKRAIASDEICKEWAKPKTGFEAFYDWVVNVSGYAVGYRLDRNILYPGNKLYAPHTCEFTPTYMHTLFTNCDKTSNNRANTWDSYIPLGVRLARYDKYGMPVYVAQCRTLGKQSTLGSFDDPMQAHAAWQHAKVAAILECIALYQMEDVHSVNVVQALLERVNKLDKDIAQGKETTLLQ
ncbi:HNH endonuclease [Pseudomonas phage PAK_P4]|uniref:HNH homing endonuclease n=1 Tax=Pseudomonas phage PAK_P4 TaxID=1327966 RepID=V5JW92_9CAUD|nr:HNH endonuclease [Pseudomonas phage PAK_P4]AGR89420.1 hypothetical protein PAK_P400124 [Pseudomonas phage PAK_P4]